MTKRVVGGSVFGIGLFLLVAAFALAFVIAPLLTRIPYDTKPAEIATEASNATFAQVTVSGQTTSIDIRRANVRARTSVQPDVAAAAGLGGTQAGRTVVWKVFEKVERTDTGEAISQSESRIALDRSSGAAARWSGQCLADEPYERCEAGNEAYAGQLYQFPFGTQKRTYQYYDRELGRALPIQYRGTDTIEGLRAYRFEQVVPEQPLQASAATIRTLTGRFAPQARTATMLYRTQRTVWVEPVTGVIVSVQDQPRRTLVPDTGPPTVLFDATFRFSPDTLHSVTRSAASGRLTILAAHRYVPIGLALLGIAGLVAGYRITRGAAATNRGDRREPVHVPAQPAEAADSRLAAGRPVERA
jgi:hypothetical protein